MRRQVVVGSVLVVVLAAAACGGTAGEGEPAGAQPVGGGGGQVEGVTVEGEGTARGAPDLARATVGVNVTRDTVEEAVAEANAAAEAVLAALGAEGVAPDDIQTSQVSIRPEQRYFEDRPPEVQGYTVTNMVEVTIRDIDRVGQVVAAVADAGGDATRVEQLVFEVDDDEGLRAEARTDAFADARRKAEQYADLADATLGGIVSIAEQQTQGGPMPFAVAEDEAAGASSSVPIARGQQEVTVRVQVVWSLG